MSEKTGKAKEYRKVFPEVTDPIEAQKLLREGLETIRVGKTKVERSIPRLRDFACCLVEEKVTIQTEDNRGFKSAATKLKWKSHLLNHIFPRFGDMYLDKLDNSDIRAWQLDLGRAIKAGKLSPRTANDRLGTLRCLINEGVVRYQLAHNPMSGIRPFSKAEHPTYTEEEPNCLTAEEVERVVSSARVVAPRYFAFIVLGFATGLRPSSIRPLRWKGPSVDVLFDKGLVLVRRSHSVGQKVMNCPKNSRNQRVTLPAEVMSVLKWHVDHVLTAKERLGSDLLFPGRTKLGFVSPHAITTLLPKILAHAGITKKITQRAWRRTFNDMARLSHMGSLVTRSISGHSSEDMTELYSTIYANEQREGLSRIVEMTGMKAIVGGMHDGMHTERDSQCTEKTSLIVN